MRGQPLGDRGPVSSRAEEAVQNRQRRRISPSRGAVFRRRQPNRHASPRRDSPLFTMITPGARQIGSSPGDRNDRIFPPGARRRGKSMDDQLTQSALDYHRLPTPGKISILPTKGLTNQRDLALAYSPGVAAACIAIERDPREADNLTARGNLVAVISNGTAVLGLGAIGPLAGKPVMEGKACLFKKFAGIDVFDIEIAETDPDRLVDIIASLEPTFGGINLEDIKAPECFEIERRLRQRMRIPVFHDDQHGTAIIVGAAV